MVVTVQQPKLFTVDGQHFIHVPSGRGDELREHLAAHGIASRLHDAGHLPVEHLDLDTGADPETVEAILEQWEG
jgi:hypothetical protein